MSNLESRWFQFGIWNRSRFLVLLALVSSQVMGLGCAKKYIPYSSWAGEPSYTHSRKTELVEINRSIGRFAILAARDIEGPNVGEGYVLFVPVLVGSGNMFAGLSYRHACPVSLSKVVELEAGLRGVLETWDTAESKQEAVSYEFVHGQQMRDGSRDGRPDWSPVVTSDWLPAVTVSSIVSMGHRKIRVHLGRNSLVGHRYKLNQSKAEKLTKALQDAITVLSDAEDGTPLSALP